MAVTQSTTFSFTLDEPCKTSAGVFKPDGTLVRTLWSKVRYYNAGTYTAVWDGKDDNTNPLPAGQYQIKLLQHNTEYVWDGAVGNSSPMQYGNTVHAGFHFLHDMAISGTNMFFVRGYDEGKLPFTAAYTTSPTVCAAAWFYEVTSAGGTPTLTPVNIYDRNWDVVCSDGNWIYCACTATFNTNGPLVNNSAAGCIVATKCSGLTPASFTNGVAITNGPGWAVGVLPNGIYVGTQPGLSGMSVQQSGNLLAVCVSNDNKIYLVHKLSGSVLSSFAAPCPGRCSWSPDGSLWVCSSNAIIHYTNVTATTSAIKAQTITTGLSHPEGISVNPTNANQILVADGGVNQQVKLFAANGSVTWVYGLPGGYQTNGTAVATNKFWFDLDGYAQGFVTWASDGTFWVSDADNHRALHFSGACAYLEQIMYQPFSYSAAVDLTDPTRVFNQFLEFKVDYTKPLSQAWTLVNNWQANVDTNHINGGAAGILDVITLTNGRTYGLVFNGTNFSAHHSPNMEVCELTTNGLRFTGLIPLNAATNRCTSFDLNGNVYAIVTGSPNIYEAPLMGFDAKNNPVWGPSALIATAPAGNRDPVPRWGAFGYQDIAISSNNILVQLDASLNNGMHLGGIKLGTTNWLWEASPAGNLNGAGNYEITNGVTYGGDVAQAVDRNIVYGYHGEFFRAQGPASQHMHYYDDGLFVGEFGEASSWHSSYEQPVQALAGNGFCPALVRLNGEYYLWHNDENGHGPLRWHLVNVRNIREQVGAGSLGGLMVLTNQGYDFPVAVTGKVGNGSVQLSWRPVPRASSYNIHYSQMNGGPYNYLSGNTTGTNFLATGLNNGQTYYFVVSAVFAGAEGIASEQVPALPFDTTQNVLCCGAECEGAQIDLVVDVNSNNPALGLPGYVGAMYTSGELNMRERDYYGFGQMANETLGTRGYAVFNWAGAGSNLVNVLSSFSVKPASGWKNVSYLKRYYTVDGTMGAAFDANGTQNGVANGLVGNPIGTINISVTDTNFHYLTVLSPAYFNMARDFKIGITAANGVSVSYPVNENPGYSHVFQFLFRGNISLWADGTLGNSLPVNSGAIIQSLFLDDAPVIGSVAAGPLAPPSNFRVLP